ncbi:ABC transporter ATP-binding protein [Acuticoccus mangrovi]|uniref:ABC transporter ATP-binding protein n=1 Tax=Acuticoccus mangrovi TaxID=2796142 RepID=A0A934IEM8_9HYPH|nr:ABC transporter ATP-binding protein [Acuticoccus mangrovi]MBJ3775204.1 ABC transporter ATP-binding protein [Acuticoccus mangrovi]
MLELREVSKRVGDAVHIRDVSIRLEPGTLNVLLGPTLAGKTTLMRLMAGLDRPTSGTVWADGVDVTGLAVQKRDVAMVYQQFINYPALTVYENIASPMRIARRPKAEIDETVARVAALLKLEPFLDRLPLQLSGGQQQRTALARALAKNARLVLLDEPLANLDYKLREELRAELPKIFSQSGAIFVYATAEPEEALLLGGHTATLHEGSLTQFGPTVDVYRRPNTLLTARTFSDPPLNWARVRKVGGVFHTHLPDEPPEGEADVPVPPAYAGLADGAYVIGLRPHHLALSPTGADDVAVDGYVQAIEITGSETYVHLDCLNTDCIMLTHGVHELPLGSTVTVHFSLSRLMVFDAEDVAVAPQAEDVAVAPDAGKGAD